MSEASVISLTHRYIKSRGDVILYVIRLAVRVEGYLSFLLDDHCEVP